MGASQSICIPSRCSLFMGSAARLEHVAHPVPYGVDADGDVIDLTVVVTALLAGEDPELLLLGADGVEQRVCERQRDPLVASTVQQQERTAHLLHDAVQ